MALAFLGACGQVVNGARSRSSALEFPCRKFPQYFATRSDAVSGRFWEILSLSTGFAVGILADRQRGLVDDPVQAAKRGKELVALLTKLGPTFIKVGQALQSIASAMRNAGSRAPAVGATVC